MYEFFFSSQSITGDITIWKKNNLIQCIWVERYVSHIQIEVFFLILIDFNSETLKINNE